MASLQFITANPEVGAYDQANAAVRQNQLQDLQIQSEQNQLAGANALDQAVTQAYAPKPDAASASATSPGGPTPPPPTASTSPAATPGSAGPGLAGVTAGGAAPGASAPPPAAGASPGAGPSPAPGGTPGGATPYPTMPYGNIISNLARINAPGAGGQIMQLAGADVQQKQALIKRQEDFEKAAMTALAAGDMDTFQYFNQKSGGTLNIPPQVLQNGEQRQAFGRAALVAEKIYKDDPAGAQKYVQAFMQNGGNIPAAFAAAGPPQRRPDLTVEAVQQADQQVLAIVDKNTGNVRIPTDGEGKPFQKGYPPMFMPAMLVPDGHGGYTQSTLNRRDGKITDTGVGGDKPAPMTFGAPVMTKDAQGNPVWALPQTRGAGAGTMKTTDLTAVPKTAASGGSNLFEARRQAYLSVHGPNGTMHDDPNAEANAIQFGAGHLVQDDSKLRAMAESVVIRMHQSDVKRPSQQQLDQERDAAFRYLKTGDTGNGQTANGTPVAPGAPTSPAPAPMAPAAPQAPAAPGVQPTYRYDPANGIVPVQ